MSNYVALVCRTDSQLMSATALLQSDHLSSKSAVCPPVNRSEKNLSC